nr:eukaryotic translation initiation factor 1A [Ipomoea batatas]GMC75262.1 eukaryotic translation initiation factor 1A [Ipomoea batatas]
MCINDTKRLCYICGKMHKKVWIAANFQPYYGLRCMRLDVGSSLLAKDVLPSLSTPFVERFDRKWMDMAIERYESFRQERVAWMDEMYV